MLDVILAASGVMAVAVGATSRRLRELPLSPPLLGTVGGVLVGPAVLGLVEIAGPDRAAVLATAARLLLAVAFMAVALRYPAEELVGMIRPVAVILGVVMPAMAFTVTGLGMGLIGVPVATAAVVGAVLAPTDPVLASSVVSGPPAERDIPERLRQMLSIESGTNDSLALPLTMGAAALVLETSAGASLGRGLLEAAWGTLLGAGLGLAAGKLLRTAEERREIDRTAVTLFALVLGFTVLGLVSVARGNEILAVFVAGIAFNRVITNSERIAEAEIDEGLNQFLVLPVFVLFGATLPWQGWLDLGWAGVAFASAVLLLRRLPWVVILHSTLGVGWRDAVWLGWFGPIGVAAIYYLSFLHRHGLTDPVIWHAGSLVVFASIVVHGITSAAGRRLYARTTPGSARRAQ